MANSAFDPLRNDPFVGAPQPVAITPFLGQPVAAAAGSSSASPWALHQQQHQNQQQQEQPEDVLLLFNNNNATHQTSSMDMTAAGSSTKQRARTNSLVSSSGGSKSKKSNNILDDTTIAPPPEKPVAKDYTLSLFHAEADVAGPASLPDWNQIKHSGTCLARISLRTLIMKKWKQIFWISYGDHTMLFFKSRFHFEDWAMDPNLSDRQREGLVKLRVDFLNLDASTRKDTEHIRGFQASMVKGKYYKSKGMVYQFKLDKWTDQGPSINAAFGSETEEDIRELHLILNTMLRKSPTTSIAMSHYAASHDATVSAAGDDSSGYFATDYSMRSNPHGGSIHHAHGSAGMIYTDERSHYSGRSNYSGRSHNSSASSIGSRSKYFVNGLKAS